MLKNLAVQFGKALCVAASIAVVLLAVFAATGHFYVDTFYDVAIGIYVSASAGTPDTGYYKNDADAEAAVKAGKVQLGSADPYREVTCFEVKA